MPFGIEAHFLLGTCTATRSQAQTIPDWPPQPDRLFSALVASWGAYGEDRGEADALRWLETLPPPKVAATRHDIRPAAAVFVPVNDTVVKGTSSARAARDLVAGRHRSERRFPTALLPLRAAEDASAPHLAFIWAEDVPVAHQDALSRIVRDVRHLGHSSSLTVCRLTEGRVGPGLQRQEPARWVYRGRLDELIALEVENARRDPKDADTSRPSPGAEVRNDSPEPDGKPRSSPHGERWLRFEFGDGPGLALTAAATAAGVIRKAIIEAADGDLPEALSGHDAEGGPAARPHLAILPLPYVGGRHGDGAVKGLAFVLPRELEKEADRALTGVVGDAEDAALAIRTVLERALARQTGSDGQLRFMGERLVLRPSEGGLKALDPDRWIGPACRWATVTPLVLDRHLKTNRRASTRGDAQALQGEMVRIIERSCEDVGLPCPVLVEPDKHSAHQGAASVRTGGPPHARWQVPARYRSRSLTHAMIVFPEPVRGPVLLGAARHYGLGFCAPLGDRS